MWKNKIWFLIYLCGATLSLFELSACVSISFKELTRDGVYNILEYSFCFFLFGYWAINEMILIIKKAIEEK